MSDICEILIITEVSDGSKYVQHTKNICTVSTKLVEFNFYWTVLMHIQCFQVDVRMLFTNKS